MAEERQFIFQRDRKGLAWDVALYVPTVIALASIALKMYYGGNEPWGYLLFFLASFFFFVGFNRIVGGRLMLLPASPVELNVGKGSVRMQLRNGERVDLVKDVRFFADFAGKSFGLVGNDLNGKRRQYVLHKGQFPTENAFKDAQSLLGVYR